MRGRQLKLIVMAVPLTVLLLLEMYWGSVWPSTCLGLDGRPEPGGAAISVFLGLVGPAAVLLTIFLPRSGATRVNKLILASGVGLVVALPACFLLVILIGEASII